MLTLVGLVANPQSAPGEHPNNAALCNQREAVESYCRSLDGKLKSLRQRTFGAPFSDEDNWREVSGDYDGIVAADRLRPASLTVGTIVVGGFDGADQTLCFNETQGLHHIASGERPNVAQFGRQGGGTRISRSSFAGLFEDCRARSRRQEESQKIEMFEQGLDPGNPAFHFCAQ